MKNKDFWLVSISYTMVNSIYTSLGAVGSLLFTPFGWTPA